MIDNHNFFAPSVDKIFKSAGVTKAEAPEIYGDCLDILSMKMSKLSATMGMSYERLHLFAEQENALVEDLKELKAKGKLR